MAAPTIRISDSSSFPEVSAVHDLGQTVDVTNLDSLDFGLLGNQKKLAGGAPASAPAAPPAMGGESLGGGDGIEFVNLEDTNVTFDVRPTGGANDSIRILRDVPSPPKAFDNGPTLTLNGGGSSGPSAAAPAPAPAPAPASSKGWFSMGGNSSAGGAEASGGGFRSWFGGGGSSSGGAAASSAALPAESEYLTPEQEAAKKSEALTLLERMDRKGIGGNKMTMANTLEEINAELSRRKDSKGLEASLRFQRSMMTTVTSGMEFLNNRYDPLGLSLDGWSEQVNENIEDYDEIFEELYDKYKDKSKVAPEVRLIMSLGLSAAMCHITNTMFKSKMPGMDDILRKNPELARQMASAAAEQAVGPGFAKFMSMGGGGGGGAPRMAPMAPPPPTFREPEGAGMPMEGMSFMPPMGSGIGAAIPVMDPRGGVELPTATARREMRGPSGVDDILSALESAGAAPGRAVPPPAGGAGGIDAEDVNSVGSGLTTETMRRNGISNRRRKATTTQATGGTLTLNV